MSNFKGFSDVQIIQEEEEESEPVKTLGIRTRKKSNQFQSIMSIHRKENCQKLPKTNKRDNQKQES